MRNMALAALAPVAVSLPAPLRGENRGGGADPPAEVQALAATSGYPRCAALTALSTLASKFTKFLRHSRPWLTRPAERNPCARVPTGRANATAVSAEAHARI